MSIAFVGVHGIGKSTTAHAVASILGRKVVELEAIEDVSGLDVFHRQLVFASKFTYLYLTNLRDSPVYTSHPLMVLPYTEYFIPDAEGRSIIARFIASIKKPVDYMVYLKMTRVDVVARRIMSRNRPISKTEANKEYLYFIDKRVSEILGEYEYMYRRLIVVDGCMELEERVERILSEIG